MLHAITLYICSITQLRQRALATLAAPLAAAAARAFRLFLQTGGDVAAATSCTSIQF